MHMYVNVFSLFVLIQNHAAIGPSFGILVSDSHQVLGYNFNVISLWRWKYMQKLLKIVTVETLMVMGVYMCMFLVYVFKWRVKRHCDGWKKSSSAKNVTNTFIKVMALYSILTATRMKSTFTLLMQSSLADPKTPAEWDVKLFSVNHCYSSIAPLVCSQSI